MKILGIDIKEGKYVSNSYNMYVDNGNAEQTKKLTKTYYIKDKKERLNAVRELLKNENDTELGVYVSSPKLGNWQDFDFKDVREFLKKQDESMFYNVWVEVSNKRALEIEVYVIDIFEKLNTFKTEFEQICYLIDQQYTEHKNVFDHPKSDLLYWKQYNNLIYDIIQKKINEISNFTIDKVREPIKSTIRKPLVWNAQKNTIGTLFGCLYDAGFIKGNKTDIVRGLSDMFDNLSKSSLTDNVNLKVNKSEAKTNHDIQTTELLKDWLKYLEK